MERGFATIHGFLNSPVSKALAVSKVQCVIKRLILLTLIPVVIFGLLKGLETYELNRIHKMCFSIKAEMPISEALTVLSASNFIEVEEWDDERVKSLGLNNSYSVGVSLLSNRTISCFIEHNKQSVIEVSTGSHFWSWLYD